MLGLAIEQTLLIGFGSVLAVAGLYFISPLNRRLASSVSAADQTAALALAANEENAAGEARISGPAESRVEMPYVDPISTASNEELISEIFAELFSVRASLDALAKEMRTMRAGIEAQQPPAFSPHLVERPATSRLELPQRHDISHLDRAA